MKEENSLFFFLKETSKGVILTTKVIPKASQNMIMGVEGDLVKIRLKAIPEKGKANKELIRFLAKELKIASSLMEIISGKTFSQKKVLIQNITIEILNETFQKLLQQAKQ